MNIYEWIQSKGAGTGFKFELGRIKRADKVHIGYVQTVNQGTRARAAAYDVTLTFEQTDSTVLIEAQCGCEDYAQRYGIDPKVAQPCKHIIAVMKRVETREIEFDDGFMPVAKLPEGTKEASSECSEDMSLPFPQRVSNAIGNVVGALAVQVVDILRAGRVPFLVGPTGCGKTSAVSKAALMLGARFYETAGADSWTDSDLVGVLMPNGTPMPGPIGAALTHAQLSGGRVLIFLDEFLRFSPRAQESMMRILLPKSAAIAHAMGIDAGCEIRVTSAPFWGESWAPADLCHIVLAANPWGNTPDPALLRRVEPVNAAFSDSVLSLFKGKAQDAIELSWKGAADGSLPLPIEYGELARARGEKDMSFVERYVARVRVIDPAAAQAYQILLNNTQS
jgi:hypothetical protein